MIKENIQRLLAQLPPDVGLVAAGKARTIAEIQQAIAAGVKIIGENYVQEAERVFNVVGRSVQWHFIGKLQKNKVKRAARIFDLVETVDSLAIAEEIDKICAGENKIMPVLIEINSGREPQKSGVIPEAAEELIGQLSGLKNIKVQGLMTMGPVSGNPQDARPYFSQTKKIFERVKAMNLAGVEMRYLSMGMSNSYQAAIEEGANIVRIGSKIFGHRKP